MIVAPSTLGVQISIFLEVSQKQLKNILKALGGPFVHHFRKLKDVGKERKRYKNVDIVTLGTEGKTFKFLEIFVKHYESLGKHCEGHLYAV